MLGNTRYIIKVLMELWEEDANKGGDNAEGGSGSAHPQLSTSLSCSFTVCD